MGLELEERERESRITDVRMESSEWWIWKSSGVCNCESVRHNITLDFFFSFLSKTK